MDFCLAWKISKSLGMPGQLVPDTSPHPLPKSSDAQVCRYKMGQYLHITYVYCSVYFKSSLDYLKYLTQC